MQAACGNEHCIWTAAKAPATGGACAKDASILSLAFISFGVGDALGGFVLGKLSDGGGMRSHTHKDLCC